MKMIKSAHIAQQGCVRPVSSHWDWDLVNSVSKIDTETETLDDGIEFWDWDWDFPLLVSNFESETETLDRSLKVLDWDFASLVSNFETEAETS